MQTQILLELFLEEIKFLLCLHKYRNWMKESCLLVDSVQLDLETISLVQQSQAKKVLKINLRILKTSYLTIQIIKNHVLFDLLLIMLMLT